MSRGCLVFPHPHRYPLSSSRPFASLLPPLFAFSLFYFLVLVPISLFPLPVLLRFPFVLCCTGRTVHRGRTTRADTHQTGNNVHIHDSSLESENTLANWQATQPLFAFQLHGAVSCTQGLRTYVPTAARLKPSTARCATLLTQCSTGRTLCGLLQR